MRMASQKGNIKSYFNCKKHNCFFAAQINIQHFLSHNLRLCVMRQQFSTTKVASEAAIKSMSAWYRFKHALKECTKYMSLWPSVIQWENIENVILIEIYILSFCRFCLWLRYTFFFETITQIRLQLGNQT